MTTDLNIETFPVKNNCRIEIDLGKLGNNLSVLKGLLKPGVRQMAVVKGNAYGHGMTEVAKYLTGKVDWLAVNDINEGIALRKVGITLPILVFEPPRPDLASAYLKYDLTATASSLEHFDILPGGTACHLNIDTGMGRLGILPEEIPRLREKIKTGEPAVSGIYSHFATADTPDSQKAMKQFELFKSIRPQFPSDWITHMANTGGTAFYPGSHLDLVRQGIGMYGYAPGKTPVEGLEPVLTWKSRLIQVKKIAKGTPVSYGATWECPEDGFLGIIPVGYIDGIPRLVSNNTKVLLNGREAPLVGTVTMNYTMCYLKDRVTVEEEQVTLMGHRNSTAVEWAQISNTIPYEILCRISPNLPREYLAG